MKRLKSRIQRPGKGTPVANASSAEDAEQAVAMAEEAVAEMTIEELQEFLHADLLDVPVDPQFKDDLKRRLWDLVSAQASVRNQKRRS